MTVNHDGVELEGRVRLARLPRGPIDCSREDAFAPRFDAEGENEPFGRFDRKLNEGLVLDHERRRAEELVGEGNGAFAPQPRQDTE